MIARVKAPRVVQIVVAALLGCALLTAASSRAMADTIALPRAPKKSVDYAVLTKDFVAEHEDTTAGVAVAVFDSRQVLYEGYFGHAVMPGDGASNDGVPVTDATVFEWGSCTKLLVWVSAMQLEERGLLDLNADVRGYLPDALLANLRFDEPVTMVDLMNHKAGFQDSYFDLFIADEKDLLSLEQALAQHQPTQIYEPGTVTAYSNYGCALAGLVIERVAGVPFYEYVQANIFEPLGMVESSIAPDHSDNPDVKARWQELRCYDAEARPLDIPSYYLAQYPAGGCISTLGDFMTFAQELLAGCPHLFATDAAREALLQPTDVYDGCTYLVYDDIEVSVPKNCHGFWMIPFERPAYGHGGNTAGCSSYLLVQPENDLGFVVMTNQYDERVYNEGLPEKIFGSWTDGCYIHEGPAAASLAPDGASDPFALYSIARSIQDGPVKLTGLTFLKPDAADFYAIGPATGVVEMPYTDLVPISLPKAIPDAVTFLLAAIALLIVPAWLIARVVSRLCHHERFRLAAPVLVTMALQLAMLALLVYVAIAMLTYQMLASYQWAFPAFLAIQVALVLAAAWNVARAVGAARSARATACLTAQSSEASQPASSIYEPVSRLAPSAGREVRPKHPARKFVVAALMAAVTAFFIGYWSLGAFWLL